MSTAVQRRRGTTAQHASFAGLNGELTVDTDKEVVVVHDGTTAGGYPQMRENGSQNLVTTGSITGGRFIPTSSTVPTNGLYLPSANSVAISTNGTGRLFVDASGQVGIGSQAAAGYILDLIGATATTSFALRNTTSTSELQQNGTTLFISNYNASGAIAFRPGGGTERLRITSGGLVGVGNSAPQALLEVGSATYSGANHVFFRNNGANDLKLAFAAANKTTRWIGTDVATDNFFLGRDSVNTDLVISNTGRVGIGTSAPSSLLEVSSATTSYIRSSSTTNSISGVIGAATSSFDVGTTSSHAMNFYTAGVNRATLDTSGRLGIGTTSPSRALTVFGANNSNNFEVGGATGGASFKIYNDTTNNNVSLGAGTTSTSMTFDIGGFEAARIDTSRRLLVGTSSALTGTDTQYSRFVVAGNTSGATAGIMSISRPEAATSITTDEVLGIISFADSGAGEYGRITCTADANAGTNDYPGRLVFSVTRDGQASPTERLRISNAGTVQTYDSSSNGLNVRSESPAGTGANLIVGWHSATNTTNGTYSFIVYANGNVVNTNNSYGAISDIKLKENIVDAGSQWSDIKALQVRKYNFKEGQTHTQIGLIAQEVELVSPGLVTESPDRDEDGNDLGTVTKSVNYSVLYMKAVKALQEAMERIEVLEQRLTDAGIA